MLVWLMLMHSSEAVPTGCQLRLHGGVGRAALIPTVEKSRVTRSEAVGRVRVSRRPRVEYGAQKRGEAGACLPAG